MSGAVSATRGAAKQQKQGQLALTKRPRKLDPKFVGKDIKVPGTFWPAKDVSLRRS
jgi:hypothetical protein